MLFTLSVSATDAVDKSDVRVLIDISGSMKQNDPKNLRRPALRLLVGLLPKGTRAGVWTFAQSVNMQIPLALVDDAWRKKAKASSHQIGSPGQFTDIEQALLRATQDWRGPPKGVRRSVVLLTDGMVDIAKDEAKNLASRQKILDKLIPQLQTLGVAVHTIALSKNADHLLMRELAESTNGWYEQVNDADQLQKVFLRIFEKVGKPDTVPLQDNKFSIDNSVTEATVLVFHQPGAQATRLTSPDGETYGAQSAPASIQWHQDEGYDMLTIKDPKAGQWKIVAEEDPDNRVIVVTDLRMRSSELPNRLIHGELLPVEVSFTDHGRLIHKPAFLNVLNVSSSSTDFTGSSETRPLLDNGQGSDVLAGDGIFSLGFGGDDLHRGIGELVIKAKGQTFVRETRMTYEVVPPVILEAIPAEQSDRLQIRMRPDEELVATSTLRTSIWLEDAQGQQYTLETTQDSEGASYGTIDLMSFSGGRRIFVQAIGQTKTGGKLAYLDSPIELEGLLPPSDPVKIEPAESALPIEPEPQSDTTQQVPEKSQDEPTDWGSVALWLGLLNLVLVMVGGIVLWWLRRLNRKQQVNLVDDEEFSAGNAPEEQVA